MPEKETTPMPRFVDGMDEKSIFIDFISYYGLEDTAENRRVCTFSLSRKRTFQKLKTMIYNEMIKALNEVPETIDEIYGISREVQAYRMAVLEKGPNPGRWFAEDWANDDEGLEGCLNPSAFSDRVVEAIRLLHGHTRKFVDDTYEVEDSGRTFNQEIQFHDYHNKILLGTSKLARFAIPIAASYCLALDVKDTDSLLFDIVSRIMDEYGAFYRPGVHVKNKLYRLVCNKIAPTTYSDKPMWGYLPNIGLHPVEWITVQYQKTLTETLPKLKPGSNPITFITSVVRNQNRYLFQSNIPVSYRPLTISADQGEMEMFDREKNMVSHGEVDGVMGDLGIGQIFRKMAQSLGREVGMDEMEHYRSRIEVHREQTMMINMFYARHITNQDVFRNASTKQYFMLFAYLLNHLLKKSSTTLAHLLCSNQMRDDKPKGGKSSKAITKKFIESLGNSHLHEDLLDKYRHSREKFERSECLFSIIKAFTRKPRLSVPFHGEDSEPEIYTYDIRYVGQEVLDFVHECSRR